MWGFFANKGAARFLAVCWAVAFPVTQWFFTYTFTFWGWVGALGVALRLFANSVTFWARTFFAMFYGAANLALWFVALDSALRATKFLAAGGTTWLFTNRLAHLITYWRVALPLAFWVTVASFATLTGWGVTGGHGSGKDG